MRNITLEELLEAGCHFGHQVTRQNPKSRDFVFETRDNIHIIDLEKTKEGLDAAAEFIRKTAANGGNLLVVATKRQAKNIVEEELKRVAGEMGKTNPSDIGLFTVTNRWIGGTLTNFPEVLKNYKKFKDITAMLGNDEEKSHYTKKEIGQFEKEREKLESFYGGTADMQKLPDAVFIVDTHLEGLAVAEATKTHIPSVGIVDTNADPTFIGYPIPANDDAVGSLQLLIGYIFDAWAEGKKGGPAKEETQEPKETEGKEKKAGKKATKKKEEPKEEKLLEAPHDMQIEAGEKAKSSEEKPKTTRGRKAKEKN